jgi:hypothetical protein
MTVSPPSTAADWVAAHAGSAPPALIARVRQVLEADPALAALPTAEALLRAAEALLGAVLEDSGAGRAVALDLLAADTCVTWAFEAAADAPGSMPALAEAQILRITEIAL